MNGRYVGLAPANSMGPGTSSPIVVVKHTMPHRQAVGAERYGKCLNSSNSSIDRGQSSFNSRDIDRSARTLPCV